MLTNKQTKEMLRNEYAKEWDTERMISYCTNKAAAVALLGDSILPIDKKSIKKHFCFGEDGGESYDAALSMARTARTSADYFKRENMQEHIEWIEALQEQLDFCNNSEKMPPDWWYLIGHHKKSKIAYIYTAKLTDIINALGGSCFVRDLPGTKIDFWGATYTIPGAGDLEKIIEAYKEAAAQHEKRVNTYLKKYGLEYVHSWTYWINA